MNQSDFLKKIANEGYNVSMACNRSYATYDFLDKFPMVFSMIVFCVSLLQISFTKFPYAKIVNILLLIVSVACIYLEKYNKKEFLESGKAITASEKDLKDLYFIVKSEYTGLKETEYQEKIKKILAEVELNIKSSHVILVTDLLAHYKLFFQKKNNSEWFCEELKLEFLKDKVPESLKVLLLFGIVLVFIFIVFAIFKLYSMIFIIIKIAK